MYSTARKLSVTIQINLGNIGTEKKHPFVEKYIKSGFSNVPHLVGIEIRTLPRLHFVAVRQDPTGQIGTLACRTHRVGHKRLTQNAMRTRYHTFPFKSNTVVVSIEPLLRCKVVIALPNFQANTVRRAYW